MDNNINSVIVTLDYIRNGQIILLNETNYNHTFTKPITIKFNYTYNSNISDTRCVKLDNTFQK